MFHILQKEEQIIKGFSRARQEKPKMNMAPFLLLLLLLTTLVVSFAVKHKYKRLIVTLILVCVPPMAALYFLETLWLNRWRIRRKLQVQGIRGPKPGFLYGNVREMQRIQAGKKKKSGKINDEFVAHDYTSTLFPYFEHWRKQYGT